MNGREAFQVLATKIREAPMLDHPFPHICIRDVLPEHFYRTLLKELPNLSEYRVNSKYPGRGPDGKVNTLVFDDFKREPWKSFAEGIYSDDFAKLLLDKFAVTKPGYSSFYLHKDLEGFEIKPHTDITSKLITYLFYLPEDDALREQLGTYLCISKDPALEKQSGTHHPWELFEIAKKVEYVPNSFFAFAPHDRSFHAVRARLDNGKMLKERDTLRGFVFNKDNQDLPDYLKDGYA